MNMYHPVTFCKRGHLTSLDSLDETPYCEQCGAENISKCTNCESPIRGSKISYQYYFGYSEPSYCYNCSKPYPWTQEVIENAIELISLDDQIDENSKTIIKNTFPDLIVETPSTPVATAKFKKFSSGATNYIKDGLRDLLIDVVSDTAKKILWP